MKRMKARKRLLEFKKRNIITEADQPEKFVV
jgi:hypothetical protein